jgi:hypothetical protein
LGTKKWLRKWRVLSTLKIVSGSNKSVQVLEAGDAFFVLSLYQQRFSFGATLGVSVKFIQH